MASIMTKRGSQDNVVTYEHICDTRADMASIDDRYVTLGSTCIILKGTSGGMEVYIADSDHQWQSLAIAGGSSSGSSGVIIQSNPLFYVCTRSEVRINGTPKITSPEENTIYLVPTNGETNNLFNEYLYVNGKWEMIGSAGIDLSEYATYSDLHNVEYTIRNELNNYASLDDNGQVPVEQLPIPSVSDDDNGKILQVASGEWAVGNLGYDLLEPKTWNGLTNFYGYDIWTDGENIYYNDVSSGRRLILDKSTFTWSTKSWQGAGAYIDGSDIWTDGENIYYSGVPTSNFKHYILDKSTSAWIDKTWNGPIGTQFSGRNIWTDGNNIYYSSLSAQYILDKATSTWSQKTWNGVTSLNGKYIWTDGDNIYYSNYSLQYILNKTTSTWSTKTWNGLTNFSGEYVWTDGESYYYSFDDKQYVLNKATSTWQRKMWSKHNSIYGNCVWTDGENYYYSYGSEQYILPLKEQKLLIGTKGEFNSAISIKEAFNDYAPIENPTFTGSVSLGRNNTSGFNEIGDKSIAVGYKVTASGEASSAFGYLTEATKIGSHAEGEETRAWGKYSHAEGSETLASGSYTHAEGRQTYASGGYSHAEGAYTTAHGVSTHAEGSGQRYITVTVNNTKYTGSGAYAEGAHSEGIESFSLGYGSHAEGKRTVATENYSHVGGIYNYIDEYDSSWQPYTQGTTYHIGDKIAYNNVGFICNTEHVASNFNYKYWSRQDHIYTHIEIIGNGTSDSARSNARALDWNGNEYLNGNLYVGCNADSTGGTKVATIDDIPLIETYPNNIKTRELGNVNVNHKSDVLRDRSYFDFSKFQSGPAILTIGDLTYNINGIFTSQVDGTADAGIENQYVSQEINDESYPLIYIVQYSGETTVSIDVCTLDSSITPSSNVASLTFISDYKLTSTANAIYLNTEADGTGGEKVATETYVNARIPAPPTTDGTYTLQVTVTDGTPTYSWV